MKITAITCVKNEGPFLLEWVAFNRIIGVTDFLIYSNDCDDGTAELLDGLASAGLVAHLPNPAKGRKYQVEALRDARRQKIAKDADWVWIADVDEFLNIHAGDGQISDLIAACDDPQGISISHQHFSDCGIEEFADKPVIAQFDRSHNPDIWCDKLEIEVKTLIQTRSAQQLLGRASAFFKRTCCREAQDFWAGATDRGAGFRVDFC